MSITSNMQIVSINKYEDFSIYTVKTDGGKVQTRIDLENSIKINLDRISYITGNIHMDEDNNNVLTGNGSIYLKQNDMHLVRLDLSKREMITVYNGKYVAASKDVVVKTEQFKTPGLVSKNTWVTKFVGPGTVLLDIDVSDSEVQILNLEDDQITIYEDKLILKTDGVEFCCTEDACICGANKTTISVHKYKGSGEIWLMP